MLKLGSNGAAVRTLQALLKADGARITVDGWERRGPDQIARGPYRISESFVARPSPDAAKALCDQHQHATPRHS